MHPPWEDNIKARLTDRAQLLRAVEKLMQHGVPEDLIPVRLVRAFYVDIDELNTVLQMVAPRTEAPQRSESDFKAVA